jgi:aminodeoxyfutalosine synthase
MPGLVVDRGLECRHISRIVEGCAGATAWREDPRVRAAWEGHEPTLANQETDRAAAAAAAAHAAPAGVVVRGRAGRAGIPHADPALERIAQKLDRGERLDFADGMSAFHTRDLAGLGSLAAREKSRRFGDDVYFVLNRQINPTNACVLNCRFCDYAKRPSDPTHYALTIDEILGRLSPELREVHIVSGLHHEWRFAHYVEIVRQIRRAFPDITIKAWTAVEIDFFAKIAKISVEDVLATMREAGLDSMPGGGAEVFSERVRRELFPHKIGADRWLEIHAIAHRMGIPTNATLLYGHIETIEERVTHLLRLREAEENAPGFLAFIPLAFQVGHSGIVERPAGAVDDLRTLAVSRLLLDNIPHLKAYWVMLGEETASLGLNFGADDMDGTVQEEKIAHAALAASPLGLARERLIALIHEAGKVPVERDALYRTIRRYEGSAPANGLAFP